MKSTRPPLWERITVWSFGAIFLIASLAIAIFFPAPTQFQYTVFRTTLALAAAGIAALIPGFIEVKYEKSIRAGGAIAVFVIVYFFNPAILLTKPPLESAPIAAVTLENSGTLTMRHNVLNGPDKLAEVKNGGDAIIEDNTLNAKNVYPLPLVPQEHKSISNDGLTINGTTFIGGNKLVEGNSNHKDVTIENAHQLKEEPQFPLPTGEFHSISSAALKERILNLAASLDRNGTDDNEIFKSKFLNESLSLVSETMARLKDIKVPDSPSNTREESDIKWGRIILLDGKLSGPFPMHCVASFLRFLADHLS